MPTGYTSDLYDGKPVTFPEFARQCARAFAALFHTRDMGLGAPLPERIEPSDYHAKELAKTERRLSTALLATDAEVRDAAESWYAERLAAHEQSVARTRALAARYGAMIAAVEAWQPPTPDHAELKAFMLQQLTDSLRCDVFEYDPPRRPTGSEWRQHEITAAEKDIAYHREKQADEEARAAERTAWIQALQHSLDEWARVPVLS